MNKEKKERTVDILRTLIWVFVILIQMVTLVKLEVYASEIDGSAQNQITVRSPLYARESDCPEPEEFYRGEDGISYRCLSWEIVHVITPSHIRPVQKEIFCGQVEGAEQIPETVEIKVWEGDRESSAFCHLEKKIMLNEQWLDDFHFPVIFHGYYAGAYFLGGYLVPGEGETPQLDGREALLLEEIGVSPEEYQVSDVQWDGEPYEDSVYGFCRNAVAVGRRKVRDYRLVYGGTAEFPAREGWQTVTIYGISDDETSQQPEDKEPETPTVQPGDEGITFMKDRWPYALWERIIRTLLVTIAIGALLFFGGLLLLVLWKLFLWLRAHIKRRKANKKSRKESEKS